MQALNWKYLKKIKEFSGKNILRKTSFKNIQEKKINVNLPQRGHDVNWSLNLNQVLVILGGVPGRKVIIIWANLIL